MTITIFTPAYNRADKLNRVYKSLINQNCKDFEWLIIDDGSTDNTKEVVKGFIDENKIDIKYYYQNNGGKHRAYNKALKYAQGDLFFTLDSDDWLKDGAVECIKNFCIDIKRDEWVFAYKEDENGKLLSDKFPNNLFSTDIIELNETYCCKGEFTIIFPLKLAKEFSFPEFMGENFVTEAVVYDRIDKNSKLKLMPEVITICEYQQDGLSSNANKIMKNNPAGFCLYFMQRIDMQTTLKNKLIIAGKYNCFKIFAKNQKTEYDGKNKLIVKMALPLGFIFLLYYKIVRHF